MSLKKPKCRQSLLYGEQYDIKAYAHWHLTCKLHLMFFSQLVVSFICTLLSYTFIGFRFSTEPATWSIKYCDFQVAVIKWQLNFVSYYFGLRSYILAGCQSDFDITQFNCHYKSARNLKLTKHCDCFVIIIILKLKRQAGIKRSSNPNLKVSFRFHCWNNTLHQFSS